MKRVLPLGILAAIPFIFWTASAWVSNGATDTTSDKLGISGLIVLAYLIVLAFIFIALEDN